MALAKKKSGTASTVALVLFLLFVAGYGYYAVVTK